MSDLQVPAVGARGGARAGAVPARPLALSSVASRLAGTRVRIALGAIVLGSFAARFAAALAHPSPQYFQDEYVYAALARSIAHGRLTVRGGPAGFPALVEPILAAAGWWSNDPAIAYRVTQGLHALVVSLAAVPVYLLARRLRVPTRDALLAAVATVALPASGWSAYVTADAVGLTVALCAIAAGVVALERPTFRAQVLFLGLALAATLTRVQYVFLPAAFLVAALVVERGKVGAAVRAFRPALLLVGAASVTVVLAGPGRVLGMYSGIRSFDVDLTGMAHWAAIDVFLVALATGVVLVPGAVAGLGGTLGGRASRAERGFGSFALVSLLALLVEASIFATNAQPRFLERYFTLAGPLLVLGLCLAARPGRGRIWAIGAGVALFVAVMRIPLVGYAWGSGKQDSPFLWAVYWLEGRLGASTGDRLIATGAAVLALGSIVMIRYSDKAVPVLLTAAIVVGSAVSLAGTSYDLTRAAANRAAFLPADMRWVDHARLGPTTVLVTPGTDPPVVSAHLFWNLDLERVALLGGAERVDAFRTSHATIADDGTVVADGVPVTGPILIEEYAAVAQLEHARLVGRTQATSLWVPQSRARMALLTEGRYLDGWLSYRSRIRAWPAGGGGTGMLRFTLSLPASSPSQRLTLKGTGVERTVVVPSGGKTTVALEVDRSRRSTVTLTCPRALQLPDSRIVCAQASIPRVTSSKKPK